MLALWARIVIVGLLLIHGLAHWNLPTLWRGAVSTGAGQAAGQGAATSTASWLLGDAPAAIALGDVLWSATVAVLVGGALLLALGRSAWRPTAITGGLLSIATMAVFWDPTFRLGLVMDVLFVGVLALPPTYARLQRILDSQTRQANFGGSKGVHA